MSRNKAILSKLQNFLTCLLLAAFLTVSLCVSPVEAANKKKHVPPVRTDRFAAIVVEASTGYVLSARNADKRLHPASLNKMMTLYLTFDALDQGKISRNQRLSVSKKAARQEPSSLGLKAGDDIRVEDVILSLVTKSANDSAVTLAEAVSGSEEQFARAMTIKARQLGMNNSRFVNASGLFNRGQYSTARDMATLSRALIHNHPKYYHYFSTNTFTYSGTTYINHNKLMNSYQGMDGIKTGYVYASGYNLAASAVRNDTRLIGVIFGAQTARTRNSAMAKLLNQSFVRIGDIRVASLIGRGALHPVPVRRPADIENIAEVASLDTDTTNRVQVDQGDTDMSDDSAVRKNVSPGTDVASNSKGGNWAIQIGAFSSRDASLKALETARTNLQNLLSGAETVTAPLMTNRGLIYRARLSGLDRNDATAACTILKGTCLILTVE